MKASPAWPGISMAWQGNKPHPHQPHSSTLGESQRGRAWAPKGLTAALLPSVVSTTAETMETKSTDCKQGGQLLLMPIFSLQQGRSPKAA